MQPLFVALLGLLLNNQRKEKKYSFLQLPDIPSPLNLQ